MHEKHPSIFCHERPLIINYHVLVGQHEMSGSKLQCAIFYFDFSDFVYFPLNQSLGIVSLIQSINGTNHVRIFKESKRSLKNQNKILHIVVSIRTFQQHWSNS
jgi:hypothetical protein